MTADLRQEFVDTARGSWETLKQFLPGDQSPEDLDAFLEAGHWDADLGDFVLEVLGWR